MSRAHPKADSGESRCATAAGWQVLLRQRERHGTELSAEEAQEREQFYSDPANREALELAARVAAHLDAMPAPPSLYAGYAEESDGYDATVSVSQWRNQHARVVVHRWRGRHPKRYVALLATAASILTVVGVMGWQRYPLVGQQPQVFRTPTAQKQQITLKDGSNVTLGARTEITVRFAHGRRLIRLERGEALFAVAHDRAHPFTVQAGDGSVTAVGTQFNVRRDLDTVTVSVTEGSVLVAPNAEDSTATASADAPSVRWEPVRLEQGQELTYGDRRERGEVKATDGAATEWMVGRFQYRDVPLKYVVATVNRYREVPIVLQDRAAGEYGFTGTVFLDHTGEWLRSLERILPVRVSEAKTGRIIIESVPKTEPDTSPNTQ